MRAFDASLLRDVAVDAATFGEEYMGVYHLTAAWLPAGLDSIRAELDLPRIRAYSIVSVSSNRGHVRH